MPNIDLHCHSNVSDGLLPPADLVKRAAEFGVQVLALTDHDDVGGLEPARHAAAEHGITLINGVEISVTWRSHTVHIVGLNIDPDNPQLKEGLASIRAGRVERAQRMAAALEARGIPGSLEGAYAYTANRQIIGRTHFARFLVDQGYVKDVKTVFKKYLIKGKPGYVSHQWTDLQNAVEWIVGSGGIPIVAHPGRYRMGEAAMEALLSEFKDAGGVGIEVVTGSHAPQQFPIFAEYAMRFGLLASRGSDFHGPGESYTELGRLPDLPAICKPVWHDWPECVQ
jgi:predicted metal-dependent phosphoesterase TrpH